MLEGTSAGCKFAHHSSCASCLIRRHTACRCRPLCTCTRSDKANTNAKFLFDFYMCSSIRRHPRHAHTIFRCNTFKINSFVCSVFDLEFYHSPSIWNGEYAHLYTRTCGFVVLRISSFAATIFWISTLIKLLNELICCRSSPLCLYMTGSNFHFCMHKQDSAQISMTNVQQSIKL